MSVVDIGFRAKLEAFKKEIDSIPGMTKKAQKEMVAIFVQTQKDAASAAKAQAREAARGLSGVVEDEAKKLKGLAKIVGGSFEGAANVFEDVAAAAGSGLGPVALLSAGIVAAGLGLGAMVSYAYGAVDSIEELQRSLSAAELEAVQPYVAALEDVQRATEGSDRASQLLQLTIAGKLAPSMERWSDAWAGLKLKAVDAVEAMAPPAEVDTFWGSVTTSPLSLMVDLLSDVGREARAVRGELHELYGEMSRVGEDGIPEALRGRPDEIPASLARGPEAPTRRSAPEVWIGAEIAALEGPVLAEARKLNDLLLAEIAKKATAKAGALEAIQAIQASAVDDLVTEAGAIAAHYDFQIAKINELDLVAGDAAAARSARHEVELRQMRELEQAREALAESERQARLDSAAQGVDVAAGFAGSLLSIADTAQGFMVRELERYRDSAGRLSKEGRQKALDLFYAQKAIALSQIAISTAVASMQAMATAPNYIVGLVMAGLTTAAGIASGVLVATEQPNFHDGGMIGQAPWRAPDEVPIMALEGEGMVSRRGMETLGRDGLDALNSGRMVGGPVVVAQVYRHRTMDRAITDGLHKVGSSVRRAVREATAAVGYRMPVQG